jgi:hypothetical protein
LAFNVNERFVSVLLLWVTPTELAADCVCRDHDQLVAHDVNKHFLFEVNGEETPPTRTAHPQSFDGCSASNDPFVMDEYVLKSKSPV